MPFDTAPSTLPSPTLALAAGVADPHPFVREVARIAKRHAEAGTEVGCFCWPSESDMGGSNSGLTDEAMRLLGDLSLLLNLIYCAEPWSEQEWRMLAAASDLPACIGRPASREAYMAGGCPRDCRFGLCPYPSLSRRPRGGGELSAGFCQAQSEVAERTGPAPWHESRSARACIVFWRYAEQYLATRDGWEINL